MFGTPIRGCVLFSWEVACTWVTRLVAAVLRARFRSCDPSWSNHGGTCSGALRSWFHSHDFMSVRPWVWRHPVPSVEVDLSVRPGPKMLEALIVLAQHNVREGWRAWVWKKYSQCGRHEVQSLPVSDQTFPSLDIKNTHSWILSSPVAATVRLGATFSPGTYSRIPSSSRSSACPWGCGALDSGSTSRGSVRTVLVLFLLNRLVLFLLDLVGPKKLPAPMRWCTLQSLSFLSQPRHSACLLSSM